MKNLFILAFSLFFFDLFANDQIISDEVYKKIETTKHNEQTVVSTVNKKECVIGSGTVKCDGPCVAGPHYVASLPEASAQSALLYVLAIAESICPGCNFRVSNISQQAADCELW